ncbi:winged helix-turn-helix domain-containing protein [Microvirga zambiensis]|uniref:winged helix-turn-helix domain-containing protein n=1 Tax=Microvirga zambiensis TaxID=1402137 RepID=UPI0031B5D488
MSDYPAFKFRIYFDADTMLGPGKADLLQGILETGSIAAAGRRMGMSYKRAWYLVDTLNHYFSEPLVHSAKGGKAGGGASLTPTGHLVLNAYRRMEANVAHAIRDDVAYLETLIASAPRNGEQSGPGEAPEPSATSLKRAGSEP